MIELPDWCDDCSVRQLLFSELSGYLDDLTRLASISTHNATTAKNEGFCREEPSVKTPRLVRRWANEDTELSEAIRDCKPYRMITELIGGSVIADPVRDCVLLEKCARSTSKLHNVVSDRLEYLEKEIRRDAELLDAVLCLLTGGEQNVFRCLLKNKPGISYDTLRDLRGTWKTERPEDEAIRRRLHRMNTKLSSSRCEIKYGESFVSRRAKLINHKKF
ncbi:hypothetical protein SAMN06265222_101625 [Neorhodopirellula lusitana]|uniref:Uncharacterized protein n=1 Tax=Neorhodopirellula lusitana TaxID=445327 RepID=A0ABY1PT64_9BACT|nr:hypothetical protein SAMN06265222_101625 [Neorhodopirellula lusitana]